jgi:hypothetical protein
MADGGGIEMAGKTKGEEVQAESLGGKVMVR